MSLTATASGFVVFLLSVQVVQGRYGWAVTYSPTEICALKGSTVELRCTYTYPSHSTTVTKEFWFTKMNGNEPVDLRADSDYSGRVQYSCNWKSCTLRITELRESDSAEYKFRFTTNQPDGKYTGSPGVTLSVTENPDLQVKGSRSSYSRRDLKCHSSCHLPVYASYIWYKNGLEIHDETSSSYSASINYADSYSCAVRRYEKFPSPPWCFDDQYCYKVTYTDRSICAIRGSSVDISCSYNSYQTIRSKLWFSPERTDQWQSPSQPEDLSEDSQYAGRLQVFDTEGGRSTLRIFDLRDSDSAEYRFRFTARSFEWGSNLPGTTLTVTALQVQVTRITLHESHTEAELKCHSSCSPAGRLSYVWFKDRQEILMERNSYYTGFFYPTDIISCAFRQHKDFPSPSVYAPKVLSASRSPLGEIVEGASVTLNCSSDANPAAKYTWYKENVRLKSPSKEPQLVFRSIQSSDSGEYHCTAENELGRRTSGHISIDVKYAPKASSLSLNSPGKLMEGSSLTLTCRSNANPAATYTWYKENIKVLQEAGGIYNLIPISSNDSGIYHCQSKNKHGDSNSTSVHIDVQYTPRLPSVSVSPSVQIMEGSSVNLTCSSDANPAANYTWYKEKGNSPKAVGPIFIITDIRSEHSGNYYCEAKNGIGHHNSTLHSIVVSSSMTSVVAGSFIAIILVILILAAFLFFWGKRSRKQTTEQPDNRAQINMGPVCYNPSVAVQRMPVETQDDLCYASVSFFQNREDPLYSNIRPVQPNGCTKDKEEEDEDGVDYTVVKFNSGSAAPESRPQEDEEEASALYSTVTKKPRV